MNKKTIAIIVGIVAVLAVIAVSIWGITASQQGSKVPVTGIDISNPFDTESVNGNTKVKRIVLDEDSNTFQINAFVLPKTATNKAITYSSSDASVATVSETGLVTFLQKESVAITLTTVDGGKTMEVRLVQPAGLNTSNLGVEITNTQAKLTTKEGSAELMDYENTTAILLSGVTYELDTNAELTLSNEVATLNAYTLNTNNVGTFDITVRTTINENPVEHVINVKVVPYVHVFTVGSNYTYFKNQAEKVGTDASEFKNANAEKTLVVGADSSYRFDINMDDNSGNVIVPAKMELHYVVNGDINITDIATINNDNSLTFKNSVIGNTYTILVSPKYNLTNKSACSFTIKVGNGVNVWTHAELKTAFEDLSVRNINMHANIKAELAPNQINQDDGSAKNLTWFHENENVGSPYLRTIDGYYSGDVSQISLAFNGNYYVVDGSNLPVANSKDNRNDGQYGALDWMKEAGYRVAAVQIGIFNVQDARPETREERLRVDYNNLKLVGNTSSAVLYNTDEEGNIVDDAGNPIDPDSLTADEIYSMIAKQGSGLLGFCSRQTEMNFNNVSVSRNIINFWQAYSRSKMKLNFVQCFDAWGNGILSWRGTSIEMYDTLITDIGGGAIAVTDASNTTVNSPEFQDLEITFGKNTVVNNFLSGTEGWFVVNGFTALVPGLKVDVNNGVAAAGKTILKTIDGESKFNFIFQNVSEISTSDDEVRDFQVKMNFYERDDEQGNPVYNNVIRRNEENTTYFKQHPITEMMGGFQYINAIGKYSNLMPFFKEMAVAATVATEIQTYLGGGHFETAEIGQAFNQYVQAIGGVDKLNPTTTAQGIVYVASLDSISNVVLNNLFNGTMEGTVKSGVEQIVTLIKSGNDSVVESNPLYASVKNVYDALVAANGGDSSYVTGTVVYNVLKENEQFVATIWTQIEAEIVAQMKALEKNQKDQIINIVLAAGLNDATMLEVIAADPRGSNKGNMQLVCEVFNK